MRVQPLEPRRVRYPRGAYGWVDLKVVTSGILERVGSEAAFTYLFLCTVGNLQGVSFWSTLRMARTLGLALGAVEAAIQKLQGASLITTNGRVIQVLPLETEVQGPPGNTSAPVTAATTTSSSRAADRQQDVELTEGEIELQEAEARRRLAKITSQVRPERVQQLARALALEARKNRNS